MRGICDCVENIEIRLVDSVTSPTSAEKIVLDNLDSGKEYNFRFFQVDGHNSYLIGKNFKRDELEILDAFSRFYELKGNGDKIVYVADVNRPYSGEMVNTHSYIYDLAGIGAD